jgi:hypothetical protein
MKKGTIIIPEKVENFFKIAESLRLKGAKLKKAYVESFPQAYYTRPAEHLRGSNKGVWFDPETKLSLLEGKDGSYKLW